MGAICKCLASEVLRSDETGWGESIHRAEVGRQGPRMAQHSMFKWKRSKGDWKEEVSRSERKRAVYCLISKRKHFKENVITWVKCC